VWKGEGMGGKGRGRGGGSCAPLSQIPGSAPVGDIHLSHWRAFVSSVITVPHPQQDGTAAN